MQGPPSVEYPVARSRAAGWLWLVLLLGWLLVQTVWAASSWPSWPGGAWWFAALAGLCWAVYGGWLYRRSPHGRIAWERDNGVKTGLAGRWVWYSQAYRQGTTLAHVEAVLDVQHTLLLRLANAEGRVWWLWLERNQQPADWDDLRRALGYSRRR